MAALFADSRILRSFIVLATGLLFSMPLRSYVTPLLSGEAMMPRGQPCAGNDLDRVKTGDLHDPALERDAGSTFL